MCVRVCVRARSRCVCVCVCVCFVPLLFSVSVIWERGREAGRGIFGHPCMERQDAVHQVVSLFQYCVPHDTVRTFSSASPADWQGKKLSHSRFKERLGTETGSENRSLNTVDLGREGRLGDG